MAQLTPLSPMLHSVGLKFVKFLPNCFKCLFIPHLNTFLFEMQNVTAACSTILFKYLIPIKKLIIQRV